MHLSPARADDRARSDELPVPLLLLLVACGYFLAAKAGQALGPATGASAACWPGNAVLLAGLLLAPVRHWWRILLAALPAHLFAQASGDVSFALALAWFVRHCIEALAGAAAMLVLRARLRFDMLRHTLAFLLGCALAAPLVVLPFDLALAAWPAGGAPAWPRWQGSVLADMAAILVLVPVLAGWRGRNAALLRTAPLARHLEGAVIAVLLVAGAGALFLQVADPWLAPLLAVAFMVLLVWAAIRFGSFGAGAALFLLGCLALSGTALGQGPLSALDPETGQLLLHLALAGLAAPLLLLCAALAEWRDMRRALQLRDQALGLACSAAGLAVWDMDAQASSMAGSPELAGLFGLAASDAILVDTVLARVHPDERSAVRREFGRAATQDGGMDCEFRVVRPDGEVRWLLCRAGACSAAGQQRVLGVAADITGRKEADAMAPEQAALRDSEAHLRQLADSMPQVLWTAGADGLVDYANRAWHALAGSGASPAGDGLWAPYICEDDRERYRALWRQAVAGGHPFEAECRFRFPRQQGRRWYLARAWPVRDQHGRVQRWSGSWTGIEDQKQAQLAQERCCVELERELALRSAELRRAEALLRAEAARGRQARAAGRLSEARFARVFRASPVAMALSGGADGIIWDVNESWQALFGCKRADAIGKTARQLGLFADDPGARPDGAHTPGPAGRAVHMRRRDGAMLEVVLSGARIDNDPDGCFITILRDETEERRRELEVCRQREQLTYLSRVVVLGELCGAIAHELNQPLASILANAQAGRRWLARLPEAPPPLPEILDDIVAADHRAAAVIRSLRALFVQGESALCPLDIAEVVREALVLAAGSLAEQRVAVALVFDEGLGVVLGDRVQLQQVLLNLVVNACEALRSTPGPARRLDIACRPVAGEGVQLTVVDSGPGIPAGVLEKVFDSFFTTKPHGLGFGLSVSRAIINAHGGRIEAANHAGGGAMFRITLPVTAGGAK